MPPAASSSMPSDSAPTEVIPKSMLTGPSSSDMMIFFGVSCTAQIEADPLAGRSMHHKLTVSGETWSAGQWIALFGRATVHA